MITINKDLLIHGFLAFILAILLLSWGVLLSPPMKDVREFLNIDEPIGLRFNQSIYAAEIIPIEDAESFFGRITHYYHSLFIILLYATLVGLLHIYKIDNYSSILNIMLIGTIMTVAGGIVYSYIDHSFQWHGLFIGGLAVSFSAGVLALVSFKPKDLLALATWITGLLLIIGGFIGGYIGSSFMDPEIREDFIKTLIETRFDPEKGDENEIWRAWTGHQHAMIALALTLAFLTAIRLTKLREGLITKIASLGILFGVLIMAMASFSVWMFGKIAHVVITPAALVLITSTLALSFLAKAGPLLSREGALAWSLRLGNIGIWSFVAVPGAIFAISLKRSTVFFNPPVRSAEWDWTELAFNIGHWHLLLLAWGVVLILIGLYIYPFKKFSPILMLTSLAGFMGSGIGVVLYIFTAEPKPYSPNPYNNIWLKLVVEPSLILITISIIGVFLGFIYSLNRFKERYRGFD